METTGWTLLALAGVVTVNSLILAVLAVSLYLIQKRLDDVVRNTAPLGERAGKTLDHVDQTLARVQERLDRVLDETAGLVEKVGQRVDHTTALAEEVVTEPLIGAVSLMAGLQEGLRTYSRCASGPAEPESQEKGSETDGRHT